MTNRCSFFLRLAVSVSTVLCSGAAAIAQQQFKVDFSKETVGSDSKSFLSVVGIWRVEEERGKKVLAVDGRQSTIA